MSLHGSRLAPGKIMLLWEYFNGSEKATQTASFDSIGSLKRLSWLTRSIFEADDGSEIFTQSWLSGSIGYISLLSGGLTDPVNPANPYAAESVSFSFGDAAVLFPPRASFANFLPNGWC